MADRGNMTAKEIVNIWSGGTIEEWELVYRKYRTGRIICVWEALESYIASAEYIFAIKFKELSEKIEKVRIKIKAKSDNRLNLIVVCQNKQLKMRYKYTIHIGRF